MTFPVGMDLRRLIHNVGDTILTVDRWNPANGHYEPSSVFTQLYDPTYFPWVRTHLTDSSTLWLTNVPIADSALNYNIIGGEITDFRWVPESEIGTLLVGGGKYRRSPYRQNSEGQIDVQPSGRIVFSRTVICPHPRQMIALGMLFNNMDFDPDQFRLWIQPHGPYLWGNHNPDVADYCLDFDSGRGIAPFNEDAHNWGFYALPTGDFAVGLLGGSAIGHETEISFISQLPEPFPIMNDFSRNRP